MYSTTLATNETQNKRAWVCFSFGSCFFLSFVLLPLSAPLCSIASSVMLALCACARPPGPSRRLLRAHKYTTGQAKPTTTRMRFYFDGPVHKPPFLSFPLACAHLTPQSFLARAPLLINIPPLLLPPSRTPGLFPPPLSPYVLARPAAVVPAALLCFASVLLLILLPCGHQNGKEYAVHSVFSVPVLISPKAKPPPFFPTSTPCQESRGGGDSACS